MTQSSLALRRQLETELGRPTAMNQPAVVTWQRS
jgi:hypothetical protein